MPCVRLYSGWEPSLLNAIPSHLMSSRVSPLWLSNSYDKSRALQRLSVKGYFLNKFGLCSLTRDGNVGVRNLFLISFGSCSMVHVGILFMGWGGLKVGAYVCAGKTLRWEPR